MKDRRARAAEILARHGLDAPALEAGDVSAERVAPLLAGPEAATILEALGDLPAPAVAALLAALETHATTKEVRKSIRRALYRLEQQGVPRPEPAAGPAPARAADEIEGLVSHVDGRGDRIVWLLRPLAGGGTLLVAAQLNEPDGLRDLQVVEVSRKQIRATRQRLEHEVGMRLVPADWRRLDALLVEAHERAGAAPGRDYLRVRPRLTAEAPAPAAEPESPRVVAPEGAAAAARIAESPRLLEQPEFRGWAPDPERARAFADELAEIRRSPLVLSPLQQQERQRKVLGRAVEVLFPPPTVARRLAGTAYVLAETGRVDMARLALEVAAVLRERPASAVEIPFIAALLEVGLGGLVQETETRREDSLVLTPGEALRARSASRPGHTRG